MDRIRNWRLPVRYKVPPRNDLIAFALMALAFGLMVGLAIAPGWGNAGSTGPLIAIPGEAPVEETGTTGETTVAADLQPPAGAESETKVASNIDSGDTAGTGASFETTATSAVPEDPPAPATQQEPAADPPVDVLGPEKDPAPGLTASVVGSDETGYAVADTAGSLLYIHHSEFVSSSPKVGRRIGTDITAVPNGTFEQTGSISSMAPWSTTKLNGVVSFVDPESGVISVSSRGVSVAVDAAAVIEQGGTAPELGSWINGTVTLRPAEPTVASEEAEDQPESEPEPEPIGVPPLIAKSLAVVGQPLKQIELAGPISWDPTSRILTIAADGFGNINREFKVSVPPSLKLRGIEEGRIYAASVDLQADSLTLAGLSANYSLESAEDPKQAFGNHAR